jgi:hypothetical protein
MHTHNQPSCSRKSAFGARGADEGVEVDGLVECARGHTPFSLSRNSYLDAES